MSDNTILKPTVWQDPGTKAVTSVAQLQDNPDVTVYDTDCLRSQLYTAPGLRSDIERPEFDDLPASMRDSLLVKHGKPVRPGLGPRHLNREQLADLNVTASADASIAEGATAFQRESDLPQSIFQLGDSNGVIEVRGIRYPASEIRMMNSRLNEARRAEYFPTTASPPMDFEAIVEDYQMLCQLREARGDPAQPAPVAWTLLRVEISRRIQDRDAALQSRQRETEAARRVQSYMDSVNLEHRMFQRANQHSQAGLNEIGDQLRSVVKNAVEQNMAEAAAPLRMNTNNQAGLNQQMSHAFQQQQIQADRHIQAFEQQQIQAEHQFMTIEKLKSQQNRQMTALENQTKTIASQVNALGSLLAPQQERLNTASRNLDLASDIVTHLSNIVENLPDTINQAVQQAVQEQTRIAIRDVMEAQATLQEQLQERETGRAQSSFQGASPLQVKQTGGLTQQSIKALVKAFASQTRSVNGALRSRARARDILRRRRSSSRLKFGDSFKDVFGGKPKDGSSR